MNPDGSGRIVVDAPAVSWDAASNTSIKPASQGGYVAIRTLEGELDFQLSIFKLPQGNIVRKIPLFSETTQQIIVEQGEVTQHSGRVVSITDYPTHLFDWSPNGRYLAFTAASDQPNADIYVYDTEQDVVQRLTNGLQLELLMEWSPDSEWIVYMDASNWYPEGTTTEGIGVVSVDGRHAHQLYTSEFWERIVGWNSNHTFVVKTVHFEAPSENLREVNVETGHIQTLYENHFIGAALDSQSKTVIVNISRLRDWWIPEAEEGLYRLTGDRREPQFIVPGSYWSVTWAPQIGQFVAMDDAYNLITFSPEGEVGLRFATRTLDLTPSPDGQWLLVRNQDGHSLYNIDGTFIKSIGDIGHIVWLPDSTGFYCTIRRNKMLYRYSPSEDWEPAIIDENIVFPPNLAIVNP